MCDFKSDRVHLSSIIHTIAFFKIQTDLSNARETSHVCNCQRIDALLKEIQFNRHSARCAGRRKRRTLLLVLADWRMRKYIRLL